jgi:hypothetical protein
MEIKNESQKLYSTPHFKKSAQSAQSADFLTLAQTKSKRIKLDPTKSMEGVVGHQITYLCKSGRQRELKITKRTHS